MPVAATKIEYVDWSPGKSTALQSLETRIGIFSTTLWSILAVIIYLGAYTQEIRNGSRPLAMLFFRLVLVTQCLYVFLIWFSLRHKDQAFGPAVVATHPRFPRILRPLAGLVWLTHFFFGIASIMLIEGLVHDPATHLDPRLWFVRALIGFACGYTTYLYLLLAVGSVLEKPRLIQTLWKARFAVDAIIALAVMFHGA